jgi:branched-subunit amino acid aminotransferase/4-amino-4-deoxychorismate lyase
LLVLDEAEAIGLRCRELSLTPALLASAQGLFLSNSVRLIRPVNQLAERQFATLPLISAILSRLLKRFERETTVRLDALVAP